MHTISAEQLLKAYNGTMKYLAADITGRVWAYEQKPVYSDDDGWTHDECKYIPLGNISITEFENKSIKKCIYKAKPSNDDWVGCVGWFWDQEYESTSINKSLGILEWINSNDDEPYKKQNGWYFKYFRPATRDEIKFFNDDTSEE